MTSDDRVAADGPGYLEIDLERPIWDRFFLPSPLILVGTREGEGYDLAPKHMCMPMGWDNYYGFMCTPRHGTYHNAKREGAFTVSVPRPRQLVVTSLAAQPRTSDGTVQGVEVLPTEPARVVDGVVLRDAAIQLECETERIVDDFGPNSLIVGTIVAARAGRDLVRASETEDGDLIRSSPLLVYVTPGRFAEISDTRPFPFPADFSK